MQRNSCGQFTTGPKGSIESRFWPKVKIAIPESCWLWTAGRIGNGYGQFWNGKKNTFAHRVSYELTYGPIPPQLVIDHICRTPLCVNPRHLRAISHRMNTLVGNGATAAHARKTHCPRGHRYDLLNTHVSKHNERSCRTCHRLDEQKRRERIKSPKTGARGHMLDGGKACVEPGPGLEAITGPSGPAKGTVARIRAL